MFQGRSEPSKRNLGLGLGQLRRYRWYRGACSWTRSRWFRRHGLWNGACTPTFFRNFIVCTVPKCFFMNIIYTWYDRKESMIGSSIQSLDAWVLLLPFLVSQISLPCRTLDKVSLQDNELVNYSHLRSFQQEVVGTLDPRWCLKR